MKQLSITELQRQINRDLVSEEFDLTYQGDVVARVIPIEKLKSLSMIKQMFSDIIDSQARIEAKLDEGGLSEPSAPAVPYLRTCEQPGCNHKTPNPSREVVFNFERVKMILCDQHYQEALEGSDTM